VLLDDLVEARVVELDKLGEVVDVGDDIAQVLLEQHKLLLAGPFLAEAALVEAIDDVLDLALAHGDTAGDLHGLDLLLRVHLFELGLELADEARLVLLGPLVAAMVAFLGGAGGILKLGLEAVVVNVVPLILAYDARSQLLAELHDHDSRPGSERAARFRCFPGLVEGSEVLDNQHGTAGY